jgi:hypothetical protein
LAVGLSGDVLGDVYLQMRRSTELEGQGGARVEVDSVEVVSVDLERATPTRGSVAKCRWNASGSVGHWGHVHRRTNEYAASFTVEPTGGAWRICRIELLDKSRVVSG